MATLAAKIVKTFIQISQSEIARLEKSSRIFAAMENGNGLRSQVSRLGRKKSGRKKPMGFCDRWVCHRCVHETVKRDIYLLGGVTRCHFLATMQVLDCRSANALFGLAVLHIGDGLSIFSSTCSAGVLNMAEHCDSEELGWLHTKGLIDLLD